MPKANVDIINKAGLSVLANEKHSHVSIICHDQPDPDCLASALAVKEISTLLGLQSTIYYGGDIAHTQNRVMINVLNIPMVKLDLDEEEDLETIKNNIKNSYIVVVDTSDFGTKKGNCSAIEGFVEKDRVPDIVIDHHEQSPSVKCENYIHKTYGACSTILYEMMSQLGIEMSPLISTALYLGISKDTDDLKSEAVTENDKNAANLLQTGIDLEMYLKIFNYKRPTALLALRQRAYDTLSMENGLIIANVGIVSPSQRSLMADVCDDFLNFEGIDTCIVMAIVDEGDKKKKMFVASLRSSALAINTTEFLQQIFHKKHSGGRKGAGAAKIPLDDNVNSAIDFLRADGDEEKIFCFVNAFFETYRAKIISEREKM